MNRRVLVRLHLQHQREVSMSATDKSTPTAPIAKVHKSRVAIVGSNTTSSSSPEPSTSGDRTSQSAHPTSNAAPSGQRDTSQASPTASKAPAVKVRKSRVATVGSKSTPKNAFKSNWIAAHPGGTEEEFKVDWDAFCGERKLTTSKKKCTAAISNQQ
ncbi:hypothetical protein BDQ17DRAFT_307762 [Cyathus striatus]|nr:hypothetical protein BDQ17DRAFT_307762 [Cyathus striatus]